ncbi:hypothetical protein ACEWY4_001943 [Coilia grayii]|uniref:Caspase-8 n=1 Tax=Coilia grayii TaxID=363190 RepID=A0ABD1KUD2_9TELE
MDDRRLLTSVTPAQISPNSETPRNELPVSKIHNKSRSQNVKAAQISQRALLIGPGNGGLVLHNKRARLFDWWWGNFVFQVWNLGLLGDSRRPTNIGRVVSNIQVWSLPAEIHGIHSFQKARADRCLDLHSIQNGETAATEMLDKLMNKGDQHCKKFISLLNEKEILNTFPPLEGLLPLQQVAPHQGAAQAPAPDHPVQEAGLDKTYEMTHSPHGLCVIINNVNFKKSKERQGSDADADNLTKVFTWLGFTVECHRNLTKDEMKTVVHECSQKARGDCFICCVLSHGGSKGVLGCNDDDDDDDKKVLPVEEILSPFKGNKCPDLAGKPKLFFIQACRGNRFQDEVKLSADSPEENMQELETDVKPFQITISADADFLVSMATMNEYYSIRHCTEGSWFIKSLCKQLREGAPRGDDILTILTRVNDDVCREEGFVRGKKAKQVPDQSFRLRKKLVFPVPNSSYL